MSHIKGLVGELRQITREIARLNTERRKLNKRKKEIESLVVKFLDDKEQMGVRYKGTALIAKNKNTRTRRKEKDKVADGQAILRKYGVHNSERIIKEVIEAMKGEVKQGKTIKVTNY